MVRSRQRDRSATLAALFIVAVSMTLVAGGGRILADLCQDLVASDKTAVATFACKGLTISPDNATACDNPLFINQN